MKIGLIGYGELGMQFERFIKQENANCEFVYFDDIAHANKVENSNAFSDYLNESCQNVQFLVALGYKHLALKDAIVNELIQNNRNLYTFIHSSAIIDASAEIGIGTVVYPGVIIDKNVVIGRSAVINLGVTLAHDCEILDASFIAPSAVLCGFVSVGKRSFIGANATIIDNVTLCADVFIGAASLVKDDLTEPGKYVGVPTRKLT